MRLRVGIVALSLLLGACTTADPNMIQIDRGQFALTYADLKTGTAVLFARIHDACTATPPRLGKDECDAAAVSLAQFQLVDADVRKLVATPPATTQGGLDWSKIGQFFQLAIGAASKGAF